MKKYIVPATEKVAVKIDRCMAAFSDPRPTIDTSGSVEASEIESKDNLPGYNLWDD